MADHDTPASGTASPLMDRTRLADAILSSALDCIIVSDDQGRIVEFNAAAERCFGWAADQVLGQTMEDTIVPPQHRDAHRKGMARFLAGGKPSVLGRRVEIEALRADGSIFPVELSITNTIIDARHFFVANLRDITAQKRTEADLKAAQASLQAIFDNIPAAVYLRDRQDNMVTINAWGARFLGRDPAEMIGQPMAKFREPQNTEGVRQADAAVIANRKPVTRPFTYHLPGGDRIGLMTFFPVLDDQGAVTQIGGMMMDATELYAARNELQEARNLLQTIFDNVPAELYLRGLDGQYLMANKWALEFYGLTAADLPNMTAESFDVGDERAVSRAAQSELLATGRPVTREYHHMVKGREATILNTIFPMRNAEGEIDRIGGVSTDITELVNARNQLRQAQDNLHQSEKLAALGQLLAGVAHELNNPLAVVLGRAAILQEKLEGTPHAAPLQKLREAAHRCARIVKTFLAMARQTGPRRQFTEVNDLVESALEMTTYSLRTSNIEWNVTRLTDTLKIEVDEDQIVQVLINLILNAQHALAGRDGARRLDIVAFPCPSGEWVHLTVADNGPGVPDHITSRIFDPFFTTKAVGEGTGLGLSVCKSMIEAHGGKLVQFKTEGGGASFRVSLPVGRSAAPVAGEDTGPGGQVRVIGRILIVDDEVEIAAILADCLTPLGVESVIATDGQSALDRLAETSFDGIFCDVSMPGMDGITFYNRLQQTNPILARHLIFVSGDVMHRDWDRLKASVDRPVIEKPFDPRQVRDAALSLLAKEEGAP